MQQLEVINILKKDLNFTDQSIEKLKEFYEKHEDLKKKHEDLKKEHEKENEDLKKKHEKEIVLLKKEVMDLKEMLRAKIVKNETNDNLNFVHETVIDPSEFQQEYIMNTEITIKEEPIE